MRVRSRQPPGNIAVVVSALLRAGALCAPAALLVPEARAAEAALASAIPAQPLASALEAFADQTGLHVVYVSRILREQTSHPVAAGLRPVEALSRLLEGTGLRFERLTAHSVRILEAAAPDPMSSSAGEPLAEVIVSANRREEALQNVPITVQVLTSATLKNLDATTFDDFLSYLPGVTAHGVGPAQNSIYIRGLGTGEFGNQASGFNGTFPNVAIYLDEQSAQLPGRNMDIYAADLERIEVLEGPQGTLFGAGAEAGVLRYITNKPKLDETEAVVDAGYATTAHGDRSAALEAVINLPVIEDELALRGVIYDERRGGYIANPPATFARAATDRSIGYANYPIGCGSPGAPACQIPPNSTVLDNASLTGRAINPITYQGIRTEALYQINLGWSALLTQSYQSIDAEGVFAEMRADALGQPQPDLTVQLFNPSYNKDRFENTALTVEGRLGELDLLYAASYLVRNVEQMQDYTSYVRSGLYVDYYQCVNPGTTSATARCFSPSSYWRAAERNTHESQELRITTPKHWRIRGVGGLFYEDYRIQNQTDWFYLTALPYFSPVAPPTGYFTLNGKPVCHCDTGAVFVPGPVTSNDPNPRPPGDAYFNDITRGYKQKAAYASIDFEIIPQSLTLTAGTRYFNTYTWEVGSLAGSFYCRLYDNPVPGPVPDPCIDRDAADLNALGLSHTYSGFRSRANLTWKVRDDVLLYYTWSQGFRAGSFNRGYFTPTPDSPLAPRHEPWQAQALAHGGFAPPFSTAPDNLTNDELGWKTRWWDQRLQMNGAVYEEHWEHAQIASTDPLFFGGGANVINGGDYRVRGVELSAIAHATSDLTVEIGAEWNHSELTRQATFYWTDGTPIDFNTLQTSSGARVLNPSGRLGSSLAGAPPFQGNIRVRYDLDVASYRCFAQAGAVHQSHSLATTEQVTLLQTSTGAYELPAFTIYDGVIGVRKDPWTVQIYGQNLTDTRAQLWENYYSSYEAITVNRPRTIGLRMTYSFSR